MFAVHIVIQESQHPTALLSHTARKNSRGEGSGEAVPTLLSNYCSTQIVEVRMGQLAGTSAAPPKISFYS